MRKIFVISYCLMCPYFRKEIGGPGYCKKQRRFFTFEFNESKEIPDWCPLEDCTIANKGLQVSKPQESQ